MCNIMSAFFDPKYFKNENYKYAIFCNKVLKYINVYKQSRKVETYVRQKLMSAALTFDEIVS